MQYFRGSKTVHRRFATVHMRVALQLAGDLLPFTLSAGQKGYYAFLGYFYAKKEIGPLKGPILTIMSTRTLKGETRPHTGCERLTGLFEHDRPPVYSPS